MNISKLLIVSFLVSTEFVFAQTDFRSGYIITNTNDTLFGEIDYRGDILMGQQCTFKSATGEIDIFSPEDIQGYRFTDSKYYVSQQVNSRILFLEYLIKGKVEIYYLRDENGNHYFLDKEGANLIEIPYEDGIIYGEGPTRYFRTTRHIGILSVYMYDAPGFQKRINTIHKPDHFSLIDLAEDYHNMVCEDEKCVIYEKKQRLISSNAEIFGGFMNFENLEGLHDIKYLNGGLLTHIWMPRENEKFFFRTGIIRTRIEIDDETVPITKFPMQIEYIYPKSSFRPKAAVGLNIYQTLSHSLSLMGGLNIKLSKNTFLSLNYDIDFIPHKNMAIIPTELLSQNISMGIYLKLFQ